MATLHCRSLLDRALGSLAGAPGAFALVALIAGAFAAGVVAPVSTLLSRLIVAGTGSYVVANTDLVVFFLRPRGLLVLLVLALGAAVPVQVTTALGAAVAAGDPKQRPVLRAGTAVRLVAARLPVLVTLALLKVLTLAVLILPFAVVGGGAAMLAMRGYDLYYFVNAKPTSFWVGLGIVGVTTAVGACVVLVRLASWILALPMCLLDGVRPREALRRSREVVGPGRRAVVLAMLAWHMTAVLAGAVVSALLLKLAEPLLNREWGSLETAALVTGAVVVVVGLASVLSGVLGSIGQGVLAMAIERPTPASAGIAAGGGSTARAVRGPLVLAGALALLLTGGATAGVAILELSRDPLSIVIAAHRGAAARAPENTVAAVALAAQVGTPWIEIDAQITSDGEVVVVHDTDLRRINAGDPRRVADMTVAEITAVDAGRWFSERFAGEFVPTLAQVIEAAGPRSGLFIELKVTGDPQPLVRRTLEIVKSTGMLERCIVVSLSPQAIELTRRLEPGARIGLILTTGVGAPERLDASVVLLNRNLATEATIARFRRAGTDVFVWTISDPDRLAPLALTGAKGVLVDDPEPMLVRAREIGEMSELERLLLAARERLRR
jgi:glycerophosphoryl diester phosphodiesterase